MPRPYVLADIIDTFNTEIGSALSPDVSDTQEEQVNQFAALIDTITGDDNATVGSTGVVPTVLVVATQPNYAASNCVLGAIQWT